MSQENTTRPTVREIASICNVSAATVSRVLNANFKHGFSVRRELQDQIIQTAEKLGYRPNLAARNLVQQQTHIIAFLGYNTAFGWPTNIYQPTCEAAIRLLQQKGYNICTAAPNLERDNTELPPWRVDGVIVLQECSAETIIEMERIQLPYVVVNGTGGPSCSSVVPDDVVATQCAVNHLLKLGHQRIAYAGPSHEHRRHASIRDRYNTYLSELRDRGVKPLSEVQQDFTSGLDYLVSTVLKQKATAIIAYDHVIAMKIIHDANILNIQIPHQVSLICFNDESICEYVVPPLTTVAIPLRQMGHVAADLLLQKIQTQQENQPPECVRLKGELILRSSTAKPLE